MKVESKMLNLISINGKWEFLKITKCKYGFEKYQILVFDI
jgi:hypothetical protein